MVPLLSQNLQILRGLLNICVISFSSRLDCADGGAGGNVFNQKKMVSKNVKVLKDIIPPGQGMIIVKYFNRVPVKT